MNATLVLYTYRLRGQMHLLPSLFTFLRDLRKTHADEKPLLLDLGEACAPDVWHCAATDGRSMLVVLDAVGYHAANVQDYLSADARTKLVDVVSMALKEDDAPFASENGLRVLLSPAQHTAIGADGILRLAEVMAGQVGVVRVSAEGKIVSQATMDVPPKTPPDPTIAGVVDFVLSEAKYYGKKKGVG